MSPTHSTTTMKSTPGFFVSPSASHGALRYVSSSPNSDGAPTTGGEGCSFVFLSSGATAEAEDSERFKRSCQSFLRSSKSFSSIARPNVTLIRRKSAVERLEESKNQYVKSEHLLHARESPSSASSGSPPTPQLSDTTAVAVAVVVGRTARCDKTAHCDKTARCDRLPRSTAPITSCSSAPTTSCTACSVTQASPLPTTSVVTTSCTATANVASAVVVARDVCLSDEKHAAAGVAGVAGVVLPRRRAFSSGRPPAEGSASAVLATATVNNLETQLRQLITASQESLEQQSGDAQSSPRVSCLSPPPPPPNCQPTVAAKPRQSLIPRSFSYAAPRREVEAASHSFRREHEWTSPASSSSPESGAERFQQSLLRRAPRESGGARATATISRSKSDIGHRVLKSRDEQERFFATIGLDSSTWAALTESNSKSLGSTPTRFFASTESVDSFARQTATVASSPAGSADDNAIHALPKQAAAAAASSCHQQSVTSVAAKRPLALSASLSSHGLSRETSIVEKNARVIKWLYSLRD